AQVIVEQKTPGRLRFADDDRDAESGEKLARRRIAADVKPARDDGEAELLALQGDIARARVLARLDPGESDDQLRAVGCSAPPQRRARPETNSAPARPVPQAGWHAAG